MARPGSGYWNWAQFSKKVADSWFNNRGKLPFHIGLHRIFFASSIQHTGEVAILQHPSVCVSSSPYLWGWARAPYVGNLFQPIVFFCSLPRLHCHRWGLGCWKLHLSAQCFLCQNSSVQCPHYCWLKTNFLSNFCSTFQMFMTKIPRYLKSLACGRQTLPLLKSKFAVLNFPHISGSILHLRLPFPTTLLTLHPKFRLCPRDKFLATRFSPLSSPPGVVSTFRPSSLNSESPTVLGFSESLFV